MAVSTFSIFLTVAVKDLKGKNQERGTGNGRQDNSERRMEGDKPGTRNGEQRTGNWRIRNGERRIKNRQRGTVSDEREMRKEERVPGL